VTSAIARTSGDEPSDHMIGASISNPQAAVRGDCLGIFEREFDYLCCTLRRLRVPDSDVEDLAHEVFLIMFRRWEAYDRSCPLRPWLFGIAFRVVASHRRRARRETLHASLEMEDPSPGPDHAVAAQQARSIVLAALEHVPLPRRAVFVMHYLDGVAMRDVASALSIPRFTAYSRLRKARREFEAAVKSIQGGANEP
jgi:RNA polymerase sigma-70 factor (ECF subfamily)